LGPGLRFFLEWFKLLIAFFLLTNSSVLLCSEWVFVHQTFSFRSLDSEDGALTIVKVAVIPQEIELPQIAVQILAADVVVDSDEPRFTSAWLDSAVLV
jgi:hypothetical protein